MKGNSRGSDCSEPTIAAAWQPARLELVGAEDWKPTPVHWALRGIVVDWVQYLPANSRLANCRVPLTVAQAAGFHNAPKWAIMDDNAP